MKSRDFAFLAIGALVGLLGVGVFEAMRSTEPEQAPTIGGQEVPKEKYVIDFSQRYNLKLGGYQGDQTYENVKVLGYTGSTVRESSGSLSSGYDHFERWLAVELPDKRRVFFSVSSISRIEEVGAVTPQ